MIGINQFPEFQKPRLRVRRINEEAMIADAVARAQEKKIPVIWIEHGGTVTNKYGYPAETECLMVVAFPTGDYVAFPGRVPANKATYSGAAKTCYGEDAKFIFDNRVSDAKSRQYFWRVVDQAWKLVCEEINDPTLNRISSL